MPQHLPRRLTPFFCVLALGAGLGPATGCQTGTQGVRSNKVQQYTQVAASTGEAVAAAEEVLGEYGLMDVQGRSTSLDGEVTGSMADGTKVFVNATRETATTSEVTVQVGTAGDNALGQEIAGKIRKRLRDGAE